MRRCLLLVAAVLGCGAPAHRTTVPSPAVERPSGLLVFEDTQDGAEGVFWIDLSTGRSGSLAAAHPKLARDIFERNDDDRYRFARAHDGVAVSERRVANDGGPTGHENRWSFALRREALCAEDAATGEHPACVVLAADDFMRASELDDGTVVVAEEVSPVRYPVFRIDPRSGKTDVLGVAGGPAFASPDGRWLAWTTPAVAGGAPARLFLRPLADVGAAAVAMPLGRYRQASCTFLAGGGQRLLCTGEIGLDLSEVVIADAAHGEVRRIAWDANKYVLLSPDQRWVAYAASAPNDNTPRIMVQSIAGGSPSPVTDGPGIGQRPIAWLP
jgi:hypothetical protein